MRVSRCRSEAFDSEEWTAGQPPSEGRAQLFVTRGRRRGQWRRPHQRRHPRSIAFRIARRAVVGVTPGNVTLHLTPPDCIHCTQSTPLRANGRIDSVDIVIRFSLYFDAGCAAVHHRYVCMGVRYAISLDHSITLADSKTLCSWLKLSICLYSFSRLRLTHSGLPVRRTRWCTSRKPAHR